MRARFLFSGAFLGSSSSLVRPSGGTLCAPARFVPAAAIWVMPRLVRPGVVLALGAVRSPGAIWVDLN